MLHHTSEAAIVEGVTTPARPFLWTIGYGGRTLLEFLSCLAAREIRFLIDVRSVPRSRFRPEFSDDRIDHELKKVGVRYVFMGDLLGGRPKDPACYADGFTDYARCAEHADYHRGVFRLAAAAKQPSAAAIMCSEGKPEDCHRSKLIGEMLVRDSINVAHIDESGEDRTQDEIIARACGGQMPLLAPGERPRFTSRKRYML